MTIRGLELDDIEEIRAIHKRYFSSEFDFPDFLNNYLCAFVVLNDNNRIISAGGVRAIAESVIVTDLSLAIKERRAALYQVLDASCFITKNASFDQLHAFIQDKNWLRHLQKIGFSPTKGQALVLSI